MKTLTLLRHAKSGHDDPVARDFDRALNAKGQRAARTMGQHAGALRLSFDFCIASPAVRVVETLDAFAAGYGKPLAPLWDRRVYLASATTLLDIASAAPEDTVNLMICGHNPGLEDLALMLARPDDLRTSLEEKVPTGSMARLAIEGHWLHLTPGCATLTHFVRPRDLDPRLGPDAD